MDYGMFERKLVAFFARQHHDPATARSRAQAIIHIAKGCDEEIVGGIALNCTPDPIRPELLSLRCPRCMMHPARVTRTIGLLHELELLRL